jgi:hypothetical protein
MAFEGNFMPVFHKHSKNLDLIEVVSIGIDKIQRNFIAVEQELRRWQQLEISDNQAKLIMYEAFIEGGLPVPKQLLPLVHSHYFTPQYPAFTPRTFWSLSNAFTSAFKELSPMRHFQVTAQLGSFLRGIVELLPLYTGRPLMLQEWDSEEAVF